MPQWAKRLAAARIVACPNQTDFAKKIGMLQQTYSLYETGERFPKHAGWLRIMKGLPNVTLDFIILGRNPQIADDRAA